MHRIIIVLLTTIYVTHSIQIPIGIDVYPSEPIWNDNLGAPFMFKVKGTYYMIGAGSRLTRNKDIFPSLISDDLRVWNYSGDVIKTDNQPGQPSTYWAPEIAEHNQMFYLFYSVGFDDKQHRLRVASSHSPLGPFNDSQAKELTNVTSLPFAIDPHPFQDRTDGQWYLFYSRDFFDTNDGYRIGTGIVVDRLVDNFTRLAGEEKVVLRARHDWQLYQHNRWMYNGTYEWHTLEGAATWQQEKGEYVCFYSGGNWHNSTYGVDYGVASSPMGPYEEDSNDRARITHSIAGGITGPGHNSIILGPDGQTTYIAYNAWNQNHTIRSPYISVLNWKTQNSHMTKCQS